MDPTNSTMPSSSPAPGGAVDEPTNTPLAADIAAIKTEEVQISSADAGAAQGATSVPPATPTIPTPPVVPNPPVAPNPPVRPVSQVPSAPVAPPVSPAGSAVVSTNVKPVPAAPGARPVNIDGINSAAMRSGANTAFTAPVRPLEVASEPKPVEVNAQMDDKGAAGINPFSVNTPAQTPSVSFADPAEQPVMSANQQNSVPKKKNNRLLIILSIIAFIVAAALVAVLVMEVMGVGPFSSK